MKASGKKNHSIPFCLLISLLSLFISCAFINLKGLDIFEKEITTFIFQVDKNRSILVSDVTGTINSDTIDVTVPYCTDLCLIPTITFRGKSLSPANGQPQTFTDGVGVPYTVYADDNTEKTYNVIVHKGLAETIPPAQVIIISMIEDNNQVNFNWTDPGDADFDHVEISWTPDGTGINTVNKGTQTFTAAGLINETEYSFSIVTVDTVGNKPSAIIIKATPTGLGSSINYFIYTADDLNAVRGGIKTGWDKAGLYIMMADVDLSGYSPWTPIGTSPTDAFIGNLDGNGHIITGLYINTTSDYQGLFGYILGTTIIKDLTISNCNITGGKYLGALAGEFDQDGTGVAKISNVHISGIITTNSSTLICYAGGLVGWLGTTSSTKNSMASKCSLNVTVTSSGGAGFYLYLGGITGRLESSWKLSECYVEGNISSPKGVYLGGLIGSSNGYIYNCYSKADVTGYQFAGGLGGGSTNNTYYSYATGNVTRVSGTSADFGGLLSSGSAARSNTCYYSGTLFGGIADNTLGTRKTPAEMQMEASFTGWDFTTIWDINPAINDGYPYLRANMP